MMAEIVKKKKNSGFSLKKQKKKKTPEDRRVPFIFARKMAEQLKSTLAARCGKMSINYRPLYFMLLFIIFIISSHFLFYFLFTNNSPNARPKDDSR